MAIQGRKPNIRFTIPTVDIAAYLKNPTSDQGREAVSQIRDACLTSGFFQITGHNISLELQATVIEAAQFFFSLPSNEKVKLASSLSGSGDRGYEVIGSQTLQAGTKPDLKEGFYIGREDVSQVKTAPYRKFDGPNVWPASSMIPESKFKEPLLEYHKKMCVLSQAVMAILAEGLPFANDTFDRFCTDPVAVLRLLHYPPQSTPDALQLGAGAHTDFGAITLLLQDENGGLQVLNHETEEWLDVAPNARGYVVNVGDMLSMWTKGKYRSNIHRVINRSPRDRYSVPFFFNGNLDCPLEISDGLSNVRVITVEEHLLERFASTYTATT